MESHFENTDIYTTNDLNVINIDAGCCPNTELAIRIGNWSSI